MKKAGSFTRLGRVGLGCLGVALVVAAGCGVSYAAENAAGADREQPTAVAYESNEAGQTYGTCADAPAYEDMPELVLVVATNGKEGYVYRDALEEAEGGSAEQLEDMVARTQEQDEAFSAALMEALKESGRQVDRETVDGFIEESRFGAGSDCATAGLVEEIAAADGASASSPDTRGESSAKDVERDVGEALAEALRASDETIPVYEADGTTVIGEFLVAGI